MAARVSAVVWLDCQIVVVIDVAVRAGAHFARWRQLVRIGQGETRRAVIEIRRLPRNRVMARRAGSHGENAWRSRVLGVIGVLPGRQVALRVSAICSGNLQMVVATDVTVLAGNVCVPVGERKIDRRSGMVDTGGSQPTVKGVASLAGLWELRGDVIRIGGLLEIGLVTGDAGG